MYGANPYAALPYATGLASPAAPSRGLVTLTTAGQNVATISDIKIGSAAITGGQ